MTKSETWQQHLCMKIC